MKQKSNEDSFNTDILKKQRLLSFNNKFSKRNYFIHNTSIKEKIQDYSFVSKQSRKIKKIKCYSAYYKNFKNKKYNSDSSKNNEDNNSNNSLFNSIIKSFNIYSRNRSSIMSQNTKKDSMNETIRLIKTSNSLIDYNKIGYNKNNNNLINKKNSFKTIKLKKNFFNKNVNLSNSNKTINDIKCKTKINNNNINKINNKIKFNIKNKTKLNINNKAKLNINNVNKNDINIYKFNIIPKYNLNNSTIKKNIYKNYFHYNNNYHINKYKKKFLAKNKTISLKSKIKKERKMNIISIELRKSKIISEEKIKDEDLIDKFFYQKPLVIKSIKPSASIIEEKKMKKKNLVPFTNSFGPILNDLYNKANFLKGSLDFMYPKIIVKKFYEEKKNAIIRKIIQEEYERKKSKLLTGEYYILKDDDISPIIKEHFRLRSA